jgi:hypothetical protein
LGLPGAWGGGGGRGGEMTQTLYAHMNIMKKKSQGLRNSNLSMA